jgi:outer membrane protein assembly factor BamD
MKNILPKYLLFVLFVVFAGACNKYEKLLKSPDFGLKYREANRFYALKKTEKALRLYENVLPFYRSRAQEDTINMQIARCYYDLYDYITATYYFDYVRSHFLRSPFMEEADYMTATCSINQVMRAELDQAQTYDAIEKLQYYVNHYPSAEHTAQCREQITKLENQLAYKSYLSAKLYYQMEHYKAAIVALKNTIKQFPESQYREELLFLAFKASYLHAIGSVEDKQQERYQATVDEYLTLISEFPSTKYKTEADEYYKNVMRKIPSTVANNGI